MESEEVQSPGIVGRWDFLDSCGLLGTMTVPWRASIFSPGHELPSQSW